MITSSLFSKVTNEIIHGISTVIEGPLEGDGVGQNELITNREKFSEKLGIKMQNIVVLEQVHGSTIRTVTENERGAGVFYKDTKILGIDGAITKSKNVFLAIQTADCIPILGFDSEKKVVFAVHAGFRGISQGIHLKLLAKLFSEFGSKPESLYFFLAPSIGAENYGFKSVFQRELNLVDWQDFVFEIPGEKFGIDLRSFVKKDFIELGIPQRNIDVSPIDTFSSSRFFSATAGNKERFWSVIGMKQ